MTAGTIEKEIALRFGDKAKFSLEGIRYLNPYHRERRGIIVGQDKNNPDCLVIIWEGLKVGQSYHHSFLEKVEAEA